MPKATFYVIMLPPPTKCHFWLSQSAYQIGARAKCVAAWLRLDHVTCLYLSPVGKSHCVTVPCGSRLSKGKAKLYSLVFHLHKIGCAHYCWTFKSDGSEFNIIKYIIVSIWHSDLYGGHATSNLRLTYLRHFADILIQKGFEVVILFLNEEQPKNKV